MTAATLERSDIVVPTASDAELAAQASRTLAGRKQEDQLKISLDDGREVLLPKGAARLLTHLLTEMGQGNAVTVIPLHTELTTQHAADVLNISRPHLIKLLEKGEIPYHRTEAHRRIKFTDLMRYKAKFDEQAAHARDALVAQAQDLGMGY
jgi:excisionase family DNA binding protein